MTRKEIYETELPHRAVAVYLYLETRADRERTCYPAIGTIARELHLSVSTVKRAIHDLECAGFIQKSRDGVRTEERAACSMNHKIGTKGLLRRSGGLWYGSPWPVQGTFHFKGKNREKKIQLAI